MLQSLHHQIVPSPARRGLSNPNSPSLQSPSTSKPTSESHLSHQQITLLTPKPTSSTFLSLLPPLPRAQALLLQMESLATKIFDVAPNRAAWLTAFRGSFPTFLSSQVHPTLIPPVDSSASNPKEIISLFTSFQTQLFEAVEELQEILDLGDTKQKLNQEIETKNISILSFAKKLKEAERVLDMLVDDYADYRRPKRSKVEDTKNPCTTTTVTSQLKLSDVISYAHKISYTTFAPPEFGAGGPLRGALPPAPQEDQMRASQLYAFSDLDVGLPKTVEDKERGIEPLIDTPALPKPKPDPITSIKGFIPQNFTVPVPPGWQPGMPVELPLDLPLPPSGWKPGDPIPLPPLESATLTPLNLPLPPSGWKPGDQIPLPSLESAPLPPKVLHRQPCHVAPLVSLRGPEVIQVEHIDLEILGKDDGSDFEFSSSSEGSSDDED